MCITSNLTHDSSVTNLVAIMEEANSSKMGCSSSSSHASFHAWLEVTSNVITI